MKTALFVFVLLCSTLVNAQIVTIPDALFKKRLLDASDFIPVAKAANGNYVTIDLNKDGDIQNSEAEKISSLELSTLGHPDQIVSLEGISGFSNLTYLECTFNGIQTLDLTGLTNLRYLDCSFNSITSLNINGLNKLQTVNCSSNKFDSLVFSQSPALKKIDCSNCWNYSVVVSDLPQLDTLLCGSNFNLETLTITNTPVLKCLNISGDDLKMNIVENLTSLQEIYAYNGFYNTNETLDLSKLVNLRILNISGNQLPGIKYPAPNLIQELDVSMNTLSSFDKTIFPQLKKLDISSNKLAALDVSGMANLEQLYCDNNWNVFENYWFSDLNVQGCFHLQKLLCSFNCLKTLDVSNLTELNTLECKSNYDNLTHNGLSEIFLHNCSNLEYFDCSSNPNLSEIDLSCSNKYTNLHLETCDNLEFINLKNGIVDKAYISAYFDPKLKLVCVDYNEHLAEFPDNVAQSPYYNFTPGCRYNTITGKVKFDLEANGCSDNEGIAGIKIRMSTASSDSSYTFSDRSGNFIIYTQADSIALTPENEIFKLWDFDLQGPISFVFNSQTDSLHVDLCLTPSGDHRDAEIVLIPLSYAARPGFDVEYKLVYKNKGNRILSGNIMFQLKDSIMEYVNSIPPPAYLSADTLSWQYADLMPFETRMIYLKMNLNSPSDIPPLNGLDTLMIRATINPLTDDETPADNVFELSQVTVNSFDPNDKTCLEGSRILPKQVGDYLHYLIRFENTGTADAINVVVRDEINTSMFDISSLVPVDASHPVYTRVTEGNIAEFIFENIHLPFDDANNDGYIAYKIKTRPDATVFTNKAEIYFDYNLPVMTNYAETRVSTYSTGIQENEKHQSKFTVFPNPVKDILYLKAENQIEKVEIYDVSGRLLKLFRTPGNQINVNYLKSGLYLLKVFTKGSCEQLLIVKE